MTRVVIVSRTQMQSGVCVGALTREDFRSVRLCDDRGGHGLPAQAPYQVGEVWDLVMEPSNEVIAPHVEDVIVRDARRVAVQMGLGTYLRNNIQAWKGNPDTLFDGLIRFQSNGKGYVSNTLLPSDSVGFWLPDASLVLAEGRRYEYRAPIARTIKYVGVEAPSEVIPVGSLVRVSLSRWFPREDPKCWLQISGWYAEPRSTLGEPVSFRMPDVEADERDYSPRSDPINSGQRVE
jgi:hypothetical protein